VRAVARGRARPAEGDGAAQRDFAGRARRPRRIGAVGAASAADCAARRADVAAADADARPARRPGGSAGSVRNIRETPHGGARDRPRTGDAGARRRRPRACGDSLLKRHRAAAARDGGGTPRSRQRPPPSPPLARRRGGAARSGRRGRGSQPALPRTRTAAFEAQITDEVRGRILHPLEPVLGRPQEPRPALTILRERIMAVLAEALDSRLGALASAAGQPPRYDAYLAFSAGVEIFYGGRRAR